MTSITACCPRLTVVIRVCPKARADRFEPEITMIPTNRHFGSKNFDCEIPGAEHSVTLRISAVNIRTQEAHPILETGRP